MKAKRIVVGKGRTWPSGEDEWTREHYEIEVEVDSDKEIPYARDWAISLIDGWLQAAAPKPKPEAPTVEAPPERAKTLMEEVTAAFPADLKGLVAFEDTPSSVLVRPRQYLGSDVFKRINSIVSQFEGEYVSAGSDSHWRIDKPEAKFDPEELMKHEWKGRRLPKGEGYGKGSLSWGWDWASEFSPSVIAVLKRGPIRIDQYEFRLGEMGNIVQTRKVKEK